MGNSNRKAAVTFLVGTVLGTAIGGALGILYAPRKGSKTRRKLRHSAEGTAKDVSNWAKDSKDEFIKTAHKTKEAFEDKLEDIKKKVS